MTKRQEIGKKQFDLCKRILWFLSSYVSSGLSRPEPGLFTQSILVLFCFTNRVNLSFVSVR